MTDPEKSADAMVAAAVVRLRANEELIPRGSADDGSVHYD